MGRNIPRASKHNKVIGNQEKPRGILDIPESPRDRNIVFSFEKLDVNEYFNMDCTCPNWSADLINMLKEISSVSLKKFSTERGFRSGTYRIHYHKDANPPVKFPHNIELESSEQIRIEKGKGGIHGIRVENIFYIIWLDPLHNMYPNERYGGLKKIKPPQSCCGWQDEELKKQSEEINALNELLEKH